MSPQFTHVGPRFRLGLAVAAPALLLTACGGSSGNNASGSGQSTAGTSAHGTTVTTHSGPLGTFLTDGSGHTLYLFAADQRGMSACSGTCTAAWPPLTTKGKAAAAGQSKSGMLGTVVRSDGSTQVTYAGHPLYYYAGDQSAGDTTGQGSTGFGASWWVVSPAGTAITHASGGGSSSPSPSSSSSSSGGSGSSGGGWG